MDQDCLQNLSQKIKKQKLSNLHNPEIVESRSLAAYDESQTRFSELDNPKGRKTHPKNYTITAEHAEEGAPRSIAETQVLLE
jgi:hypothetical protein